MGHHRMDAPVELRLLSHKSHQHAPEVPSWLFLCMASTYMPNNPDDAPPNGPNKRTYQKRSTLQWCMEAWVSRSGGPLDTAMRASAKTINYRGVPEPPESDAVETWRECTPSAPGMCSDNSAHTKDNIKQTKPTSVERKMY